MRSAFTLIETILVVAVLSLLLALALPVLARARQASWQGKCTLQLHDIAVSRETGQPHSLNGPGYRGDAEIICPADPDRGPLSYVWLAEPSLAGLTALGREAKCAKVLPIASDAFTFRHGLRPLERLSSDRDSAQWLIWSWRNKAFPDAHVDRAFGPLSTPAAGWLP